MPPAIQKFTLDWFLQKCPPELVALLILIGLLLWLALRINRVISHAFDQEAHQTARLDVLEKATKQNHCADLQMPEDHKSQWYVAAESREKWR